MLRLGRNANGEPLCLGTDWTEEPFVPSDLKEPRYIGGCSYLTSYEEYDEEGTPYEEHEYHKYEYFVLPDGSAKMDGVIETPWQSGQFEKLTKTYAPGTWVCDPWTTWPEDFGSRTGMRVLPDAGGGQKQETHDSIYQKFKEIRWSTTPVAVAITRATLEGIQPYHALLALHRRSPSDPEWAVELLLRLVHRTSGTQLCHMYQHADGDSRRYYLRAISSRELPYDRARGYCPVERRAHRIASEVERCDVPEGAFLGWSHHEELRRGVAAHGAFFEFQP